MRALRSTFSSRTFQPSLRPLGYLGQLAGARARLRLVGPGEFDTQADGG
jgi:hypothetical protein